MAVIPGTTDNDTLNGSEQADQITGLEGDDVIFGGGGSDNIDGGLGNDFAQGDAGNDTILGAEGDDTVDGGDNNDSIEGGAGSDFLFGNFGNDNIVAGDGDDTIDGGAGDDTIDGGAGENDIFGLQAGLGDGVYQYTIDDLNDEDASNDKIVAVRDLRTAEGNDGFDTLIGIEFIQFSDYKIPALAAALTNKIPILDFALLENDPDLNASQLGSTQITSNTLSTTDEDNTAEQLTYTVTDLPDLGNLVVNGTAIAVGGTFTQAQVDEGLVAYTNTSGDLGDKDTFTFTVSDGLATLDRDPDLFPLIVTFEIAEQNNPVAANDSISANEDNPITVAAPGVLENDTDADSDVLTVDTVNEQQVDAGISITFDSGGIATIDADGGVVFDPNGSETYNALGVGDTLVEDFTYTVIDGRGGEATATATITINGVNDAPIAEDDGEFLLNRVDTVFTINIRNEDGTGLLDNDIDPDGDPLTITTDGFTQGTRGTVELVEGNVIYTLNTDAVVGLDTFFYTVSDGNGGTDTAAVVVDVQRVGELTAENDAYETDEDTVTVIAPPGVLENDQDPEFDDLNVSEVNGEAASVGTAITLDSGAVLTLNADGGFTYDPTSSEQFGNLGDGETDTDNFTYTVSDGNGNTDEGTVTITVDGITDVGDANALDDAYTTGEDTVTVIAAPGVLANDEDPDTLNITQVNGGDFTSGATITLSSRALLTFNEDGSFTYNPNVDNYAFEGLDDGQTAVDSFTYTVDNGTDTDTATVDITIEGVDDLEQRISTDPKAPKSPIGGGEVSVDIVYTTSDENPNLTGLGLRLFFNSTLLGFDEATGLVDVFAKDLINQSVVDDTNNLDGDTNTDKIIAINWADTSGAADWTGTIPQVLYTVNFTTDDAFESSTINFNATDTATLYILDAPSVTLELNEAPDAVDDTGTITANALLTQEAPGVLANDTDPDNPDGGQTLTITEVNGTDVVFDQAITLASGALLTISADGAYIYNPNGAFNDVAEGETDTDSFTYTISDGLNGTDTATVNITIEGVTSFTLDIDGNGTADALTDGILVLRHLFGFTGSSLTEGALAEDATITDPDTIAANLEANRERLDIDDNGATDALTDGILVLRDLFGFSGDALIAGALGDGAQRNTPDAVATYIDTLFPG